MLTSMFLAQAEPEAGAAPNVESAILTTGEIMETWVIPWGLKIAGAILIFLIGRWVSRLVVRWGKRLMGKSKLDPMLIEFFESILGALLFLVVIIAAVRQLGVDTTSLVALVGAAGLAVGLALQDSLKNFASGVMLILQRPFAVGNFVEAGGVTGIVEEINIFSTRMRTLDNKEITVPNGQIHEDAITNFSARDTRRVDLVIGIGYDSDLRKARQIIEKLLSEDGRVLKEPETFVGLGELADSSVNFLVRPWVKAEDYLAFKCDYLEKIKLSFDAEGIAIPYPQMDVHLSRED